MFAQPRAYVDFKLPKLCKGKVWYVYYYVKDPGTGKFKRFRVKVNRYSSQRERLAAAKAIMADLSEKLPLGWSPFYEASAPHIMHTAYGAFDAFLKVKAKEMEDQSLRSYRSYVNVLRTWLDGHGFDESTPMSRFTKLTALSFMDSLEKKDTVSPRTYNNYLAFLTVLWDWLVDKGYAPANLFRDLKRKPKRAVTKKRRLLTTDELSRLFGWLDRNNPEYLAICLLCYCCFIRPKEIALLKCKDIDLDRQTVHVSGEIAKNDKESYRTIPDDMMQFMRRLDLSHPDWYLFGKHRGDGSNFKPGREPMFIRKTSAYWEEHVRPACKFGLEIQFYSLKDTGITNMLGEGVPINYVQQQADHSSVAMTAIYVGRTKDANATLKQVDILHK